MSEWRQGEVDSTEASSTVVIKPLVGQGQLEQASAEAEEEEEDEGNARQPFLHVSLSLHPSAVTYLGGGSSLWPIEEANQAYFLDSLHEATAPFQVLLAKTVPYLHSASTFAYVLAKKKCGSLWTGDFLCRGDTFTLLRMYLVLIQAQQSCTAGLTVARQYAGPPSNYDEDGVLTTELSSLSELRLIKAAAQSSATDLQAPTATVAPTETITTSVTDTTVVNTAAAAAGKTAAGDSSVAAAAAASAPKGEQSSAQQASASAVPNVGAWAELSNQIARRKAELASKAGEQSSEAVNSLQGDESGAVTTERKVKVTRMQTPGAARPRGGVRASAMGPMLAFLRSSGGLDGNAA